MTPTIKSTFFLLPAFLICSVAVAQQVTNPSDNIPVTISPVPPTPIAYPGLTDNTTVTLHNYVRTQLPDKPIQDLQQMINANALIRQTVNYFDGLGRPLQTVGRNVQPDGKDIVQHYVYDATGKEAFQYLPYAFTNQPLPGFQTTAGRFHPMALTDLQTFYNATPDENPYSKVEFDYSPINRVTKRLAPGKSWVGSNRGTGFQYRTNEAGDDVRKWVFYDLRSMEAYAPGELFVTETTDEDGKKSLEYKDKQGKLILKKIKINDCVTTPYCGYASTYYVYDELNHLRYVLPPEAVRQCTINGNTWTPSQGLIDGLCYRYFYDERGRMIEKKVPGKAMELYVYDVRDRLVMYQDGKLRAAWKWKFTYYDPLDRPTMTTLVHTTEGHITLRNIVKMQVTVPTNHWLYGINNYNLYQFYPGTITDSEIQSYTYYDDYNNQPGFYFDDSQFNGITLPANGTIVASVRSNNTRNKLTGGKVKVIDPDNPTASNWLEFANYYDSKGRLIQAQSQNIKGGLDISSNIYYFQGMLWKNIERHNNPSALAIPGTTDPVKTNLRIEKTFNRNLRTGGGSDQVGAITQRIESGNEYPFASYTYDHAGRIISKQTPAGNTLQEYNIRGFLNRIQVSNPNNAANATHIFEEKLSYDKGFTSKLYNGNIAGITWKKAGNIAPEEAYGYSYDNLNRLTHAEYVRQNNGTAGWNKNDYDYTASNISYDLNGNILTMNQRGLDLTMNSNPINMDQLTYTYAPASNQLIQVSDAVLATGTPMLPDFKDKANQATEYTYDVNGNLIADANKQISTITYESNNKPEKIEVQNQGMITYVHDAAGNVLQKKIHNNTTNTDEVFDYIGNFVYKNNLLQYITNEEGRARPVADANQATAFIYDYFVKDHLGNVRSTLTAQPMDQNYLATHEIAMANVEQLIFDNIPNVRDNKPGSTNPNDVMAARLTGVDDTKRVGTAAMLKTMPGDRFTISTDAFYNGAYQQNSSNTSAEVVESLLSALLGGNTYPGVPLAELPENIRVVKQTLENPALAGQLDNLLNSSNDPNAPKAHLNVLFFDDKMQLIPAGSSIVQVNTNSSTAWSNITPGPLVSAPTGSSYVLVYIDNQSRDKDVWFDNVTIQHYTSEVLEESHYYPFGLTLQTSEAPNVTGNPFKYNGMELEKSFGLEMYDFHARQLDPQLGRFTSLDPHADLYNDISPYASMNNSPSNYVDPNGKDVRIGMQQDKDGNITITLSSTIYVKGYNQKEKTAEYNQFLKDNPNMLSNTTKNEDGSTTTVNVEMQYAEATDEDVARVTNEETRNGDNIMFIGADKGRSSAAFIDKNVTDPITGEVTKEKFTSFTARLGGKDDHYGSSRTAFHETMHLFGLKDWYKTAEDRYKVGFYDMMNNHTSSNTKPILHQTHWNSWGKVAHDQQQRSGSNNFIINRPVETP